MEAIELVTLIITVFNLILSAYMYYEAKVVTHDN